MPVWSVKKRSETNEKLMRRFKKQVQNARFFQEVRNEKFHSKPKTKRRIRQEAIAREKFRTIREKEKLYL